jgi:hypothetical protein
MDCPRFEDSTTGDPIRIEPSPSTDRASALSELRVNDRSIVITEIDGRIKCPA